jgi:hypothetical protein
MRAAENQMTRPVYIAVHALTAGAFMYLVQSYALHATPEYSALWALAFGAAAAVLAWRQTNR